MNDYVPTTIKYIKIITFYLFMDTTTITLDESDVKLEARIERTGMGYVADIPSLDGCFTRGRTFEETLEKLRSNASHYYDSQGNLKPKNEQPFLSSGTDAQKVWEPDYFTNKRVPVV